MKEIETVTNPNYYLKYINNNNNNNIDNKQLAINKPKKVRMLLTSRWGYPFGGGEAIFYQCMKWATLLNMETIWIAFSDPATNQPYQNFQIIKEEDRGTRIYVNEELTTKNMQKWICLIQPDFVHHQGHNYYQVLLACDNERVLFVAGFNFWIGLLQLDPKYENINMLENAHHHKASQELEIIKNKAALIYVASEFMQDVVYKITDWKPEYIMYPTPSPDDYLVSYNNILKTNTHVHHHHHLYNEKHILQINIHKNKGGLLFLEILKHFKNDEYKFICVQTEHNNKVMDDEIKNEILKYPKSRKILQRQENIKPFYDNALCILVPSMVDETYCRVVVEAMGNGIPVLTTGYGNIKNLVGLDCEYILNPLNPLVWIDKIKELHKDKLIWNKASAYFKNRSCLFTEEIAIKQFKNIVDTVLMKSNKKNLMIITPWCDQGLGIQSRNYVRLLAKYAPHIKVSIFAYKSYFSNKNNQKDCNQNDPDEWIHDCIYYSANNREQVQYEEIFDFVERYNIGTVIIPETCWSHIFRIAKLLKMIHVKCFAIPNAEILRQDEIEKHKVFYGILANNRLCQGIFLKYGFTNVVYVGYSMQPPALPVDYINKKLLLIKGENKLKFLFLGGLNAFTRKQVIQVLQAFTNVKSENIMLHVYIQKADESQKKILHEFENNDKRIHIHVKHINYKEIENLYKTHDVNIQVSKHEGLGLGFYEALHYYLPTITLHTLPHTEIIIPNVCGWACHCTFESMADNNNGFFGSAIFNPFDLTNTILLIIANNFKCFFDMMISLEKYVENKVFSPNQFVSQFLACMDL